MRHELAFLRISAGLTMLLAHGYPKLQKYSQISSVFPDPLGIGSSLSLTLVVFAEVLCALLLVLGIGVRLVALPLMITMAVAFFIVHGADPFAKKELAFMFLIAFTTIFIGGGGAYTAPTLKINSDNKYINWLFEN